jgi:transposase, IS5 family
MERAVGQPTFADVVVAGMGSRRLSAFFADVDRFIPWDELARLCSNVYDDDDDERPAGLPNRGGRPHSPVKLMLKLQFLQACFNLSDPAAEDAVNDRLSFREFLGLKAHESAPDETTIVKFRGRMVARGHGSTIFDRVKQMLNERGLILKEGTIVDATIIERGRGQWSRSIPDDDAAGDVAAAEDLKPSPPLHTRDMTAGTTIDKGRTVIGHKASIATDVRGTITDFVYDSAACHESNHFDQLTAGERIACFADRAYWGKRRLRELQDKGLYPGIGIKRVRGQPELTRAQKLHNRNVRRVRVVVEHPLALIKRLGLRRLIYRGLSKNAFRFAWFATVVNFKRNLDALKAGVALAA